MSIQYINTINPSLSSEQNSNYIKGLLNLGQRKGVKGDGVTVNTIALRNIIDSENNKDIVEFAYSAKDDSVKIYLNNGKDIYKSISFKRQVDNANITIHEINTVISKKYILKDFTNCTIIKKDNGNYLLYGYSDGESILYICEIDESTLELIDYMIFFGYDYGINNKLIEENKNPGNLCIVNYGKNDESESVYTFNLTFENILESINETIVKSNKKSIDNLRYSIKFNNDNDKVKLNNIFKNLIENCNNNISKYIIKAFDKKYYNAKLEEYIFASIIKKLYEDSKTQESRVYASINLEISVNINDNGYVIYNNSEFINAHFVNDSSNVLNELNNKDNYNLFIVKSVFNNKISMYSFYIHYLENTEDLEGSYISSINVYNAYTLPYIQKNKNKHLWYVNDICSGISAEGEAGSPNILMVQYTKEESTNIPQTTVIKAEVLHTYTDDLISFNAVENTFKYNTVEGKFNYYIGDKVIDSTNIGNSKSKPGIIILPNLDKLISDNTPLFNLYKNCLLFAIVDTDLINESNQVFNIVKEGTTSAEKSYITVFWHVCKNEKNIYEWKPVTNKDDNDTVLGLSEISGIKELVKIYINKNYKPDKYLHDYVVFSNANNNIKQSNAAISLYKDDKNSEIKTDIYPIIKIENNGYYEQKNEEGYSNTLNFVPKFLNKENISFNSDGTINNVNDISSDNKTDKTKINKHFEIDAVNKSISHSTNIYNKTVPSSTEKDKYPIWDFKEVLVNNETIIDSLNIMTVGNNSASNAKIYNAYIGNEYGTDNKDVLYIGTNEENYSINANKTLVDNPKFNEFRKIKLGMPTEELLLNRCSNFNIINSFSIVLHNLLKEEVPDVVNEKFADSGKADIYINDIKVLEGLEYKFEDTNKTIIHITNGDNGLTFNINGADMSYDFESYKDIILKQDPDTILATITSLNNRNLTVHENTSKTVTYKIKNNDNIYIEGIYFKDYSYLYSLYIPIDLSDFISKDYSRIIENHIVKVYKDIIKNKYTSKYIAIHNSNYVKTGLSVNMFEYLKLIYNDIKGFNLVKNSDKDKIIIYDEQPEYNVSESEPKIYNYKGYATKNPVRLFKVLLGYNNNKKEYSIIDIDEIQTGKQPYIEIIPSNKQ